MLPAAGVTGTSTDVAVGETGIEIAATTETGGGRKPPYSTSPASPTITGAFSREGGFDFRRLS